MSYVYNGYSYEWNSANKKKVYGGKHSGTVRHKGEFKRGDAGVDRWFKAKAVGIKRVASKSKVRGYSFVNKYGTTEIIRAESFQEALRIARSRGLSARNYKAKRRKKR